jgi:uncharacterized protein YdaU (DUF1376 family)
MSNRARMPLHVGDYLADTGHVTATEHGAYLLLIMHYWQNGCLPENERIIARIAKLSPEQWEESRDMLAMLFGPGWTHKRIDAELSKADEIIEKRRSAAEARREAIFLTSFGRRERARGRFRFRKILGCLPQQDRQAFGGEGFLPSHQARQPRRDHGRCRDLCR